MKQTIIQNDYNIGDIVITCGRAIYEDVTDISVPTGSVGTIIKIRHRSINTPNECKQYKIRFDNYPDGDDITNLYLDFKIRPYIKEKNL